jgi:hypothetical protein
MKGPGSNLCRFRSYLEFIKWFIRYESAFIKEIEHFFPSVQRSWKQNSRCGWGDVDEATKLLKCTDRFDQIENKPEGLFSIK